MRVALKTRTRRLRLRNERAFADLLGTAASLAGLDSPEAELEPELHVVLIGVAAMRKLNRQFLGKDSPTDVLAFDLRGPDSIPSDGATVVGEIYVCPAVAVDAARDYDTTPARELVLYIVHGMLHLAGLRDGTERGRTHMRRAEERVMQELLRHCTIEEIFTTEAPSAGRC